ncbi:MAG TPA: PQQ-binding-like beta-propeller repeat protein [Gemmataceae bacterium]|nr:PQQ-binding-like beta-propeller repeat protein [Gemmataceae bacterium]
MKLDRSHVLSALVFAVPAVLPPLVGSLLVSAAAMLGIAAGTGAAQSPTADARSWPMLGGTPQRNMVNSVAKGIPSQWDIKEGAQKNIKWVASIGTRGYGCAIVSDGKVFVGTNNQKPRDPKIKGDKAVLLCFRESDGQFLWQLTHDMPPPDVAREARGDGLLSNPVVEGQRLYYVTPAAEVICADVNGSVVWRFDMMDKLKVFPCYVNSCSPLLVGDLLFVTTGNGRDGEHQLPSPKAPSFVAIDKKTGTVRWQDSSPGTNIMDGQWSNPVYAEANGKGQVIFPGGDGWLYAFEPANGKLIWKFDCNPKAATPYKPGGRGQRNFFLATPVVHDQKVYVGLGQEPGQDGPGVSHFWCVDITKTGDVSPVNDNFDPRAPVNKNSALVWHYGGLAKKDSGRDWDFGRTISTCAVQDGLVYIAEMDGYLHCLDARTGQKYWEHDLKAEIWGSPYWVDGKIYLGDEDGDVCVFAHGKEKKLLGQMPMEQPIKGTPVVANGVLYVVTDTQMFAIANK